MGDHRLDLEKSPCQEGGPNLPLQPKNPQLRLFVIITCLAFTCCSAGSFFAVRFSNTLATAIVATIAVDVGCTLVAFLVFVLKYKTRQRNVAPEQEFTDIQPPAKAVKTAWGNSALRLPSTNTPSANCNTGPVPFAYQPISVLVARLPAIQASRTDKSLEELDGQFTAVVLGCVRKCRGVVHSFGGGLVVATWNAFPESTSPSTEPVRQESLSAEHSQWACRTALHIKEKLAATRECDLAAVHMAVVTGLFFVGETDTHEGDRAPVIIGPYLEVAFRIAELNRLLNTSILVTEPIRDVVKDQLVCQIADHVRFEDIPSLVNTRLAIYELLGKATEVSEDIGYLRAYDAFISSNMATAQKLLQQLVDDPAAPLWPEQERSRERLMQWAKAGTRTDTRVYRGWNPSGTTDAYEPGIDDGPAPSLANRGREQSSFYHLAPSSSLASIEPAEALRQQFEFFHKQGSDDDAAEHAVVPGKADGTDNSKTSTSALEGDDDNKSCATEEDFGDDPEPTPPPLSTDGCFFDVEGQRWYRGHTVLGRGGFGIVYLGMNPLGMMVAIKSHNLDQDKKTNLSDMLREIGMLSKFNHRNIVRYLGSALVGQELLIVMEYVPCGTLAEAIAAFSPIPITTCARYAMDILRGLAFLHANNVIHRDIKPSNVLVSTTGRCKLADFGLAGKLGELPAEVVGTLFYMAPEMLQGGATPLCDIFSFGVTMYEMLAGKLPWTACHEHTNTVAKIFALHVNKHQYPPLSPTEYPPEAVELVESCLSTEPLQRPSAEMLQRHPFFLRARAEATVPGQNAIAALNPSGGISGWASGVRVPADHPAPPLSLSVPAASAAAPAPSVALSFAAVVVEPVEMEHFQQYQSQKSFHELIHGNSAGNEQTANSSASLMAQTRRKKRKPSVVPPKGHKENVKPPKSPLVGKGPPDFF
eukprot:TRINITY_DN29473_c0_g1_i1.p1 TRINITY_DN29473_c0_g1~~TRINITY_DN29473_c0_g1_i1.p1  ORF type:complete len:938 (-),score=114.50 TRINITY_DN29473_c0_g1_i1:2384-5167(-)